MQRDEAIHSCELPRSRGFVPRRRPTRTKREEETVHIRVRNPRTHISGGKALYTDYKIEVKTSNKAFHYCQSSVRRRFSEFEWLSRRLAADYMGSNPPLLPAKKVFGRFKPEFLRQRQTELGEFLLRVVSDILYLSNKALHLFLQTNLPINQIDHFLSDVKRDDLIDVMTLANRSRVDHNKACDSALDSSYSTYDVDDVPLSVDETDLIASGYYADDEVFHGEDTDVINTQVRSPSPTSTTIPSTFDNIMHRVDNPMTFTLGYLSSSSSDDVLPPISKSSSHHSLSNVFEFSFNLSESHELDSGQGSGSESYVVLGHAHKKRRSSNRSNISVDTYDVISISYDGNAPTSLCKNNSFPAQSAYTRSLSRQSTTGISRYPSRQNSRNLVFP